VPTQLDEYPIHQAPLTMRQVSTSDRNFYDRCYFCAHERSGEVFVVTGLGVYPNLGVIDAYASVRRGDRQWSLRCSDALGERALDASVGPYRVEVIEPLSKIRVCCDPADGGVGLDLLWEGSFACIDEPRHLMYAGERVMIDSFRFAQVGTWSGTITAGGSSLTVDPGTWVGARDRSWGIRPVGEAEPPGRWASEAAAGGFWWLYCPLRFDDFALIVIAQEAPDGTRTLSAAERVFGNGRREQLGWPEIDISYRTGTRHPERAVLHLRTPDRKPLEVEVETRGFIALHVGCGYGADPDWVHGQWKGRGFVECSEYNYNDAAVASRVPFGVIDHVAHALCDGQEGWGLFEHASVGRHDPSGFVDWAAVAP
jgi:hypothetical protein